MGMIHSGLVSVTFRRLDAREIIRLAAAAGLAAIEWGGDIHVPHGDLEQARHVRRMTVDAGLVVASYGSYYRVGVAEPCPFETVLDTALALGAPNVRVWAGQKGSAEATAADRAAVVHDARHIAALAQKAGVSISFELHGQTLTDTTASARRLLETIAHDNVHTYWQPPQRSQADDNVASIEALAPWLSNVHVFHWIWLGADIERRTLNAGAAAWRRYLRTILDIPGDRYALLEFVRDDEPANLVQDAATLNAWLTGHSDASL
jgi:sugar phosphate isomerase/epimerase